MMAMEAMDRTPITQPRTAYRPYEYPEFLKYRDAIRHSYWVHTEFSYSSDVQDYALSDLPLRELVKRSLIAISQVELSVKLFWARLYDHLPKPEIAEVGMTFAESEVRHANAYAHLLDLLGLEDEFSRALEESSVLRDRARLAQEARTSGDLPQQILLFSTFVEHVSLFSQFYSLMALNRRGNQYKGISNAIEATSKEENIHGLFGVELLKHLPKPPEEAVRDFVIRAYRSEVNLLDWMFEKGDTPLVSRDEVLAFLENRINEVLALHGYSPFLPVKADGLKDTEWFALELLADKEVDFFNKRSVAYARRVKSFDPDELF